MTNHNGAALSISKDDIEQVVCRMWEELLGMEKVGRKDNFLLLGGESLLATQVAARLSDVYGLEIPLRSVLIGTVEELAQEIVNSLKGTKK